MDSSINSNEIKELERTESLWLCNDDSLEKIISSRSKQSNSSADSQIVDKSNLDLESQTTNHVDKTNSLSKLSFAKTINLLDFKNLFRLKELAENQKLDHRESLSFKNDKEYDYLDELSDTSTSSSDFDEDGLLWDESEEDETEPVKLTDLMIYKTIQFMDYRRFARRFNGIRKPVSNKKALIICLFCAVLALVPFVVFRRFEFYYVVSIQIKRGVMAYISSLAFLLASFLLAKIQLSLPLRLPVILSYLFMFITLIVLIVVKNMTDIDKYVWPLLISYASVQIFLITLTKAFIYFVPLLALNGQFFPCTEHFHLLKRTQTNKKLNITISRYNDYTTIWETRSCGFFTCIYRSLYRLIISLRRRIDPKRRLTKLHDATLFGHQMRYYGKIDSNNLPHGYGEWLEDHIYGERLHGYWWHGYPVGPFTSQEIGSGSIFVNNRVAFITDTHLGPGKTRYGVSSTECSISGHFFRQMPRTYFFNPEYRKLKETMMEKKRDIFYLHQKTFDNIKGSSPQWCIGMLKRQFHLNKPSDQSHMSIYVDKLTESLKIEGHRIRSGDSNSAPDEIIIKLIKYKGKGRKILNSKRGNEDNNQIELHGYKAFARRFISPKRKRSIELDQNANQNKIKSKISMLIRDEDDWENRQQMLNHKIIANGWSRVKPSTKNDLIPETVALFIHGYNTTLNQACSQMAHIVSFSKLPPYVLPLVFNWKGHSWGIFSAFSYPKAIKRCTNPNIVEAFTLLIEDLIKLGVKNIHFLVHSCGARIFFNVISAVIQKGLVMPVLSEEFLLVNPEVQKEHIRMDSLILINPDYPMERFRNEDYFLVRGYCDHIVMYVNNRDNCLWISEFYNRERSLGKCIFEMCTSPSLMSRILKKNFIEEPFTIYDAYASTEPPKNEHFKKTHSVEFNESVKSVSIDDPEHTNVKMDTESAPNIEVKVNKKDESANAVKDKGKLDKIKNKFKLDKKIQEEEVKEDETKSGLSKRLKKSYSLNRYRKTRNIFWSSKSSSGLESYETRSLWLDMDVIDTSMIDTNVDFLKHSFYQVKREIMDDIREVILLHTRAEHRQSRLDRRRGNVYVFRVAPGDVRKLF